MKNKKLLVCAAILLLCVGSFVLGQILPPTDTEWRTMRKEPILGTIRIIQFWNREKDINSINVLQTRSNNIQREKILIDQAAQTPTNTTEVRQYCILSVFLPIK